MRASYSNSKPLEIQNPNEISAVQSGFFHSAELQENLRCSPQTTSVGRNYHSFFRWLVRKLLKVVLPDPRWPWPVSLNGTLANFLERALTPPFFSYYVSILVSRFSPPPPPPSLPPSLQSVSPRQTKSSSRLF